jgi:competence protein ComEC
VQQDRWLEFTLATSEKKDGNGVWVPARGGLLVRADRWATASYGDHLEITGRLALPTEGGGFSYRDYLRRQGILAITYRPKLASWPVTAVNGGLQPFVFRGLYTLKLHLTGVLRSILPEPESSLAQGILLGNRTSMPEGLRQAFARTNTTHIIAISGFNMSLLAGALLFIFGGLLGKQQATIPTIAGVVAYTILVGAGPSVVRAAMMGTIMIIGAHLGRRGDTLVSLVWAAGLMTLIQPSLIWDVGFQLSFLATAGLVVLTPLLQKWSARLPRPIGDDLATTLAAQIAVLPVLVTNFHQVSLVTIPANLLVLPAFPPIMVLGGLATALGALWQPLGQAAGWLVWPFLAYTIRVVEIFSAMPVASISLGPLPVPVVWLYYAILSLWIFRFSVHTFQTPANRPAPIDLMYWAARYRVIIVLTLLAALLWVAVLYGAPPAETRLTFLDVGQGDAALIRTPDGRVVLVDGGPSPAVITNALGRRLPFWRRDIDAVILTHPHDDHLTGLLEVVDRYRVYKVLDAAGGPLASRQRLKEISARRGSEYIEAIAGQEISLGYETAIQVVSPQASCSTVHSCSVVVRLISGAFAALITGDIDPIGQRAILASGLPVRAQILKVPHHGAADALAPGFLAEVRPELAIISVGRDNSFGHPARPTLDMLAGLTIYRTDIHGNIEIIWTEDGLRAEVERKP